MMFERDSEEAGIYQDIFDAVSQQTADEFIIEYMPVARVLVMFDRGQIDLEPGILDEGKSSVPWL